ncbi:ABC-type Fe3+-hydroxamate transport system substrate-binding protein [Nocardioides cavernae]|uniref:ABC-type Fe3+-hydroxamate transport system substrate-binding protein n=1 Tax=Nocardioides cavernae TaxID=1921566 RepID=A0A7Y9KRR2_9ACTN|nr:helical backbone metal receptor [Nocardioides cavernae]NYE36809.1 ABC-type Fe3+-hydroxamate transport system substrate-binding protein [Nocardioides cavernae]
MPTDDLGADVPLTGPGRRVVSLVPSLTEALATSAPERLVGATDWCTHPADLAVDRVRGTKNPDLAAVHALAPDLVVANQEENRELDVRRLRDAGVNVWVTRIETVEQALDSMSRLFGTALGLADPPWLVEARDLWSTPAVPRLRVAVPIWRDPWMVVGSPTYTDDLLARAGLSNVLADGDGRYPTVTPDAIDAAGADVVLLPDEPYVFTADDGPEALATPTRLVSGRLLTWYGPAMVEAHALLTGLSR